jgi:hypothetical protein
MVLESSSWQKVVSADKHHMAASLLQPSSYSPSYSVIPVQVGQPSPSTMIVKPKPKSILKHPAPLHHHNPSRPRHGAPKKRQPRQNAHQDPQKTNRWFFKLLVASPTSCIRTSMSRRSSSNSSVSTSSLSTSTGKRSLRKTQGQSHPAVVEITQSRFQLEC